MVTPPIIGRNRKKTFDFIKDRVWHRMHNCSNKKLSRAGKEVLIKIVAQALPIYVMNVFLLPLDVCKDLEKMLNSFWWGSKEVGVKGLPG